jgi:hemolysin III
MEPDAALTVQPPLGPSEPGLVELPRLRGRIHQAAAVLALAGTAILVRHAASPLARRAAWVYGLSMVALYATSSSYHVFTRAGTARAVLRRADHAMIFVLIAGTYTPVCLLALPQPLGLRCCFAIWAAALVGILLRAFPRRWWSWLAHTWYFLVGFAVLPLVGQLQLSAASVVTMALAGLTYTVAAVLFFCHIPRRAARWFGYHELWHSLGVLAGLVLFVVNYQLIATPA